MKNQKNSAVGLFLRSCEKFFFGIFFLVLLVAMITLPPAINIYRSVSTGEIVKIETKEGIITDQAKIKEALSGRYDGCEFLLP